uniref:Transcriptional regulator ATRX n=1 Tax=Cacopsylla melanoneura TaxID=428564 RepID=A0A8D8YJF2_9HEMI
MADSDTEMGFDPAAFMQMDMDDAGTDYSGGVDVSADVDIGNESDTGAGSDQQTPTKNDGILKLKSFEDEKQFITLMELANGVQREEMDARAKHFDLSKYNSLTLIKQSYSHCTMCNGHVPIIANKPDLFVGHPILKTLVCKKCCKFYGDGNFDRGDDGVDLYCRWCAEGGLLFCCSSCPNVFCKSCVKKNFGLPEVKKIDESDSWNCYVCEPKHLWGYRGMYATISQFLIDLKNTLPPDQRNADLSSCCVYNEEKKAYVKTQNKITSPYSPGVYIPQVKAKMGPPIILANTSTRSPVINHNIAPQEEDSGSQVNDFFSNGHFLEAALPPLPPPPLKTINPPAVNSLPRGSYILIRQQVPRQQLIRPKNLLALQATPPRMGPPALVRRTTPNILRPTTPGALRSPSNMVRMRTSTPQLRTSSSQSYVIRTPNNVSTLAKKPSSTPLAVPGQVLSSPAPSAEWFNNILDQAMLSADFYKDEIVKLKLNAMSVHRKNNINYSTDNSVLNTVRSLNWIMKSILEQGLDIRRSISKQYPKTESNQESVNMARLHKMKGAPFFNPQPASPIIASQTQKKQSFNSNLTVRPVAPAAVPYRAMNGKKSSSSDVVDLVSDDEDGAPVTPRQSTALTIYPVRTSLPAIQRTPLTPTPSNRLSIPAQTIKGSPGGRRGRRKKKMGSDDSDDDDYIPRANPVVMKKRKKSLNNSQTSPQSTLGPKLMVTNVRSLQPGKSPSPQPKSANNMSLNSYMNQVSEDVMAQVCQLDASASESSDIEEILPEPVRDPLEDDDKDDWITKNPTAYEKYCLQYDLVKDWYVGVKTMNCNETDGSIHRVVIVIT